MSKTEANPFASTFNPVESVVNSMLQDDAVVQGSPLGFNQPVDTK